jgi:hypothetical protein
LISALAYDHSYLEKGKRAMQNGNGDYNSGNRYSGGSSTYANRTRIAGIEIKPMYVYIAIGILLLVALYFLVNILRTTTLIHFGMAAGALLLIANMRELIGKSYAQHNNTALLNCLIGGSLVSAWLGEIAMTLFWVPALALFFISVPLTLNRASVYSSYMRTARGAMGNVRRAAGRAASRWN